VKRIGKITTATVAQGMCADGEWEDLCFYFGDTPKQQYNEVIALIGQPGFEWKGARIIERTVIEYPTGWQKLSKADPKAVRP